MPDKLKRWFMGADTWISLISDLQTQEAIDRRSTLEHFLQEAMDGTAQLFVSTATIVEVVRTESIGLPPAQVPLEIRQKITDLFEEPYITLVPLEPARAADARELRWIHPWLRTMDAIELASALYAKVDVMYTYDGSGSRRGLISLSGLVGTPPMTITVPKYTGGRQAPLIT
ncbi:MAG: PIN domain-containing protein [Chloroflexi bacterium]|nr:PIN domain-containing protein [Chloroflexota bacterium]